MNASTRPRSAPIGMGALIGGMVGFVVLGAPMVYYLWTTINELLAGQVHAPRLGIAAGVLLLFAGLLLILSRTVRRLDDRSD